MGQGLASGPLRGVQQPGGEFDGVDAALKEAAAETAHGPAVHPNAGVDIRGDRNADGPGLGEHILEQRIEIVQGFSPLSEPSYHRVGENRRVSSAGEEKRTRPEAIAGPGWSFLLENMWGQERGSAVSALPQPEMP